LDYINFFQRLSDNRIDYLLVGGLAVNFHGIPRMTYDIDIMILLEVDNIKKLVDLLKDCGYRPRINEDPINLADENKRNIWIKDKGMKAFTFWADKAAIREIDVVFYSPIPYEDLKQRAVNIKIKDVIVPTISIEDLIKLK